MAQKSGIQISILGKKQGGIVNSVLPNFAKFLIGGYIKYCQFYGLRSAILKKIWNDFSEKYLELHLKARLNCHKLTRMLICLKN